jgi:arylsulfatase A-like enzyme
MDRRFFGKWHCGHQDPYNPVHHGFDEFVGLLNGAGDHHRHGSWRVGLRKTDVEGYPAFLTLFTPHCRLVDAE